MGKDIRTIASQLSREDLLTLLECDSAAAREAFRKKARQAREQVYGRKIFLYGFVYFSTWCRNNCNFCYYRKENTIDRYRKSPAEILELAKMLQKSGVHLIDLTMGEDPFYHQEDFASVLAVTAAIKQETGLPVMISPGVISKPLIEQFAALGTDWYALYQETHNRKLYHTLRADQDYDERMEAKLYAQAQGMLIEEGLLAGVGETASDIADSILQMGQIGARQVRVMSFVPQAGSPMETVATPNRERELDIISALRLAYPEALIPASLDVDGIAGLAQRIEAGANVVTSIIPPKTGLMGVAQKNQDVDEGGRTVAEATAILHSLGLEVATAEEYQKCVSRWKDEENCDYRRSSAGDGSLLFG